MNATTPFALEAQPSSLLSRLDCGDPENIKDARHALRRCATDADYRRWATQWGENLCNAAEEYSDIAGGQTVSAEEHRELEEECNKAEAQFEGLKGAVELAVKRLDDIGEQHDIGRKLEDAIGAVTSALEAALVDQ